MNYTGWQGGLLDHRVGGTSIPLVPLLNVRPGVGPRNKKKGRQNESGNVPEHLQNIETKKTDLHVRFLEGVLEGLNSGYKVVKFKNPLSDKDARFFKITLRCFNRRTKVGLASDRERKLVGMILDGLSKCPEKDFDFSFEPGNSALVLTLLTKEEIEKKAKKKQPAKNSVLGRIKYEITRKEGCKLKSIHKIAMKVYMLEKVVDFMKTTNTEIDINTFIGFETDLFKYMKNVCDAVNKRETLDLETKTETGLVKEIAMYMDKKYLTVEQDKLILTFTKVLHNPSEEKPAADETINIVEKTQPLELNNICVDEDLTDFSDMEDRNEDFEVCDDDDFQYLNDEIKKFIGTMDQEEYNSESTENNSKPESNAAGSEQIEIFNKAEETTGKVNKHNLGKKPVVAEFIKQTISEKFG